MATAKVKGGGSWFENNYVYLWNTREWSGIVGLGSWAGDQRSRTRAKIKLITIITRIAGVRSLLGDGTSRGRTPNEDCLESSPSLCLSENHRQSITCGGDNTASGQKTPILVAPATEPTTTTTKHPRFIIIYSSSSVTSRVPTGSGPPPRTVERPLTLKSRLVYVFLSFPFLCYLCKYNQKENLAPHKRRRRRRLHRCVGVCFE